MPKHIRLMLLTMFILIGATLFILSGFTKNSALVLALKIPAAIFLVISLVTLYIMRFKLFFKRLRKRKERKALKNAESISNAERPMGVPTE